MYKKIVALSVGVAGSVMEVVGPTVGRVLSVGIVLSVGRVLSVVTVGIVSVVIILSVVVVVSVTPSDEAEGLSDAAELESPAAVREEE